MSLVPGVRIPSAMASLLASAARRQAVSFRCVGRRVGQATVAVRSSPAARPAMWAQSRAFAVSAAQIKELRNLTMAPISDCKKALNAEDVDGDLSKAVDWLRKNGVATASKKAGRSAAEGVVSVAATQPPSRSAVVVEVNSETDFVGRNTDFMAFVEKVAGAALDATSAAAASDVRPRPCVRVSAFVSRACVRRVNEQRIHADTVDPCRCHRPTWPA